MALHPSEARRDHDRERRESARSAADVRFESQDLREGVRRRDRHHRGTRDEGKARVRIPEGRHRGRVERYARPGHELSLEAATTTDEEEERFGILFGQGFRDREERAHVTARPATDEKHAARSSAVWFGLDQRSGGYPRR